MNSLQERLEATRREFDDAFARPREETADVTEDLLAIRIGATPFALRIAELTALRTYRAPTPLPGGPPGLLGLGAESGQLLAVYDLGARIGSGAPSAEPRWQVVPRADSRVALAFTGLDGLLRVPAAALIAQSGQPGVAAVALAAEGGTGRTVLDLGALVATIHRSAE